MERISKFRAVLLLVLFIAILCLFSIKLYSLQIIETDGNTDNTQTYTTLTRVKAARGDILDRNGNVLVSNRASYDLVFNHYVIKSADSRNDHLYRLIKKCQELGIQYNDHLPVTTARPFEYNLDQYSASWRNYFQNYMRDRELDSDISATLLIRELRDRYKIPMEWTDEEARAVIGLRYEFDLRGVTNLSLHRGRFRRASGNAAGAEHSRPDGRKFHRPGIPHHLCRPYPGQRRRHRCRRVGLL